MVAEIECGDALLVLDDELRIVAWNAAAEQLTGYAAAEMLGRHCWEVVAGLDELGEPFCRRDCELAARVRAGRPVPAALLRMRTAAGRRLVALSTLAVACPGARHLLVHLARPAEARDGARGANHRRLRAEPVPHLTGRQQEVLQLLASGLSTAEMGARLSLSRATVRNHVAALLRALGCHSRVELLAEARRLQLL
jgi:DNA-binding CsgD family transcriptional regulator